MFLTLDGYGGWLGLVHNFYSKEHRIVWVQIVSILKYNFFDNKSTGTVNVLCALLNVYMNDNCKKNVKQ